MNWGQRGPGTWITVYAHAGHAYVVVAGCRFDTSMHDPDAPGPRDRPALEQDAPHARPPSWRATRAATEPARIA